MKLLSLIIPIYNEEEVLPLLRQAVNEEVERIRGDGEWAVEIILVDDGSGDGSYRLLEGWAAADKSVKVLRLSRNFGHQNAFTAGFDAASGDAVVTMDGDLQDPPEVISQLLAKADEGYDVVSARRSERAGEGPFKRGTAWLFYRLINRMMRGELQADTGDFRLVKGEAVEACRSLREQHRFLRGLSTWIGFRQGSVEYVRRARPIGSTGYSTAKMVQLAWNATSSFSTLPLTIVTLWGVLVSLFGLAYLGYTLYHTFILRDTVPGWASLVVLLCLIGGSILMSLGIVGSYVGKIFEEVKGRPIYLVQGRLNFSEEGEHQGTQPGE